MIIECFLTNLYSIDVMAPFCLEMKKRGIDCHLALDELFWKVSYGDHFDINKAIKKAKEWGVKLNLRLNYDADIAVTQWTSDWELFGLYKNLKARVSYGALLNRKTIFYDFKFDIYFVYGDFEKEFLISKGIQENRIIKIGYPKLSYQTINFKLQKDKAIITYLPTWDEYSTIEWLLYKIKSYMENYCIFIKPHPLIFSIPSKQKYLTLFRELGVEILEENVSTKSIAEFSDIIITDLKSGVTCDILYFNPKKHIITGYNKKDKNSYFDVFDIFDNSINENDKLIISNNTKDKTKFKNHCFEQKPEFDKIKEVVKLRKISNSETLKNELKIIQRRLLKNYKETRC